MPLGACLSGSPTTSFKAYRPTCVVRAHPIAARAVLVLPGLASAASDALKPAAEYFNTVRGGRETGEDGAALRTPAPRGVRMPRSRRFCGQQPCKQTRKIKGLLGRCLGPEELRLRNQLFHKLCC
eukprot:363203-Chlamydomonas_euryale.AAC.29